MTSRASRRANRTEDDSIEWRLYRSTGMRETADESLEVCHPFDYPHLIAAMSYGAPCALRKRFGRQTKWRAHGMPPLSALQSVDGAKGGPDEVQSNHSTGAS